ncbi:MAG: hypothetical protein ACPGVJ_09165, partial [Mangrovicoccus sp.]
MDRLTSQEALLLLEWQIELGASETIGETPVDRYAQAAEEAARKAAPQAPRAAQPQFQAPSVGAGAAAPAPLKDAPDEDPVEAARQAAAGAFDLPALHDALAHFPHCGLKKGARSLVFAD